MDMLCNLWNKELLMNYESILQEMAFLIKTATLLAQYDQ